ncbi:hypothetical protein [Thermincola potens]|uniref:hypothetical protein n=1 Tax=Thermincola potens TaxID=863643 RepID=UPI0012FDF7EB|nr:hypothetical protein [Thermincola potens]
MSRTGGGLTIKDIIMSHRVWEHCLLGKVLQHKAPWQRRAHPPLQSTGLGIGTEE